MFTRLFLGSLSLALAGCAAPAPFPRPAAGSSAAEVQQFYAQLCTRQGVEDLSVADSIAEGNPGKAFEHQACVDRYVRQYIQQLRRAA